MRVLKGSNEYFNQKEVWEQFFTTDPFYQQKARIMLAMIPPEVETILDVGCGNGEITQLLSKHFITFGMDKSWQALSDNRFCKFRGDAAHLAVKADSIDLVFCSELLEHLSHVQLRYAIREFQRLAKCYLLISVPYNEKLPLRHLKCPECGCIFHIWGHKQKFDMKKIKNLFPDFNLISWSHCGNFPFAYHPALLFLRQRLGNHWYDTTHAHPVCPNCGNTIFSKEKSNKLVDFLDDLNRFQFKCVKSKTPYWIVALYQRK
jgi:SAM-dependent methyltransferase